MKKLILIKRKIISASLAISLLATPSVTPTCYAANATNSIVKKSNDNSQPANKYKQLSKKERKRRLVQSAKDKIKYAEECKKQFAQLTADKELYAKECKRNLARLKANKAKYAEERKKNLAQLEDNKAKYAKEQKKAKIKNAILLTTVAVGAFVAGVEAYKHKEFLINTSSNLFNYSKNFVTKHAKVAGSALNNAFNYAKNVTCSAITSAKEFLTSNHHRLDKRFALAGNNTLTVNNNPSLIPASPVENLSSVASANNTKSFFGNFLNKAKAVGSSLMNVFNSPKNATCDASASATEPLTFNSNALHRLDKRFALTGNNTLANNTDLSLTPASPVENLTSAASIVAAYLTANRIPAMLNDTEDNISLTNTTESLELDPEVIDALETQEVISATNNTVASPAEEIPSVEAAANLSVDNEVVEDEESNNTESLESDSEVTDAIENQEVISAINNTVASPAEEIPSVEAAADLSVDNEVVENEDSDNTGDNVNFTDDFVGEFEDIEFEKFDDILSKKNVLAFKDARGRTHNIVCDSPSEITKENSILFVNCHLKD